MPGGCKGKAHAPIPRLRRAARADLPQMVRQDAGRPPRRPQELAPETLGVPATDPARYAWELVEPGDQDHMDHARRLLHVVADRARWQAALSEARRRAEGRCRVTMRPDRRAA